MTLAHHRLASDVSSYVGWPIEGDTSDAEPGQRKEQQLVTIIIRIALAILFVGNFVVGAWNAIWPASFYTNFPTVDLTPPFSEHYARDFGTASLAIALLLGIAAVKPRAHFVIPAAGAYSVFAVPHFFYHLTNMENATVGEAILLLTTANAAVALVGLVIILLTVLRDRRAARHGFASVQAAH